MKTKRRFYRKVFFYSLVSLIIILGGSRTFGYEWSKTFGGSSADVGHSVQQTTGGGYIIAGRTRSIGASIFDLSVQGIYYGFIVNNTSHFVEIQIMSTKNKHQIFSKVAQPASISFSKNNMLYLDDRTKCKCHLSHVIPLWLKLDCYNISIRYRDDLIDNVQPGQWKSTVMVLDKEYAEASPGPFTLEIEED